MGKTVWILCADYGREGLEEPFIAFETEAEAEDAKRLCRFFPADQEVRITEAPLYDATVLNEPPS